LRLQSLIPRLVLKVRAEKFSMAGREKHWAAITFNVALALVMLPGVATAQSDDADPSGRVARLGYVQGEVSIQPAGIDDWAAADLNRPIATGDKLWTDADSRAELSIGSAFVRLASNTAFSFLTLDDHIAQMQLPAGTVSIHVRSMSDQLELDTPNVAVALLGPGDYRLEVNAAGDATAVEVANGIAEVSGGGQDFAVHPQQAATFSGASQVTENLSSLGPPDAFDTWSYQRDRDEQEADAWNYVPADTVGAEDLDQYGTWQQTPDEGYVWSPNSVVVGWAPYRFGHWIWIQPWGWTWVDEAPWGFAPFHYGRWTTFGGRWCWVPGSRRVPAVYAPALVAWVSGGPLVAAAAFGGAPGIGWFPLGPHEVYVPAYPASASYVQRINLANTRVEADLITRVYNHGAADPRYLSRYTPGAITAVATATFSSATAVGRNSVRVPSAQLNSITVSATAPPVTPQTLSILGAGAAGPGIPHPPAVFQNRAVVAKTIPATAPVPFALMQQAIRENGGRPLGGAEISAMAILAPATHVRVTLPTRDTVARTGMARAAFGSSAAPTATPPASPPPHPAGLPRPAAPVSPGPSGAAPSLPSVVPPERAPSAAAPTAEDYRPPIKAVPAPAAGSGLGNEPGSSRHPPASLRPPPVYAPPPASVPAPAPEPASDPRPTRHPSHPTSHPSSDRRP
jgi:hypothetical protein